MIILFLWDDAMPMGSPFLTLQRCKKPSYSIVEFQETNINVLLSLSSRIQICKVYVVPGQISRTNSSHENEEKILYQRMSRDEWPLNLIGRLPSTINTCTI